MDIQKIHTKLDSQCPSDYKINEIILFAYPYRRLIIHATVNKSPEKSIQQVYAVFLRTILAGYNREEDIIQFLGLHKEDFILRELYFLRERGFVDMASGTWLVTEQGKNFIKDNSILKILEEEDFDFLIDARTDEVLSKDFRLFHAKKTENKLEPLIEYSIKSSELLDHKNEQLATIYKQIKGNKAYLVDYDKSNIKFDKKEYHDYYLIEYIPIKEKEQDLEAYIEIRNTDKEFSKNKRVSKIMAKEYPDVLYHFSNSDRKVMAKLQVENLDLVKALLPPTSLSTQETETLSIWETQAKFGEALKTVKKRILIESPWIKRATLQYIPLLEAALKRKVEVIILYGIEGNDEHHRKAEKQVEQLDRMYPTCRLVHLPSHFEEMGNTKMTGTHRKLVIKDNEYYIQGSFNFLSFNRKEGQTVANEESILIRKAVGKKWDKVVMSYCL